MAGTPQTDKQAAAQRGAKLAQIRTEQAKQKRNKLIGVVSACVLAVGLVATLVTVALVNDPPSVAVPRGSIEIAGLQTFDGLTQNHVDTAVSYPQTPPVGGDHSATWLNCGIYSEPVPNENAVHDLEHGAVWVTYDPAVVDEAQVQALRDELPETFIVLSPLPGTSSPIMLTAWGAQVGVDTVDDERIGQFVDKFWTSPDAPEPGAPCTGGVDAPGRIA